MKANGAWTQEEADDVHDWASSPNLAKWLVEFFKGGDRVYDFGCGKAFYLSKLQEAGFGKCWGIEGTKLNNFLIDNIEIADLSQPEPIWWQKFGYEKGDVISLEVGEHIPKEGEQNFLDTITDHCNRYLVTSWALPGQPGLGHVNCQSQEYIISEIERRGFKYMPAETKDARSVIEQHCDWFQRTLLVFKRA